MNLKDTRIIRTRAIIKNIFMDMYYKKEIDDIYVKEITDNAQVK